MRFHSVWRGMKLLCAWYSTQSVCVGLWQEAEKTSVCCIEEEMAASLALFSKYGRLILNILDYKGILLFGGT